MCDGAVARVPLHGLSGWATTTLESGRLDGQQVPGPAIALEEDARIYTGCAEALAGDGPGSARPFRAVAAEEDPHRHRPIELYRSPYCERPRRSAAGMCAGSSTASRSG